MFPGNIEWVLIIDADERITPELEREIRQAICRTDVDGFYLNRRFWFRFAESEMAFAQTPYNAGAIFRFCEARLAYIPSTKIMFVLAVR